MTYECDESDHPGRDIFEDAPPEWVPTGPVRGLLFQVSHSTGVPWWVLLDHAGWPPRFARRMGMGPMPLRIPRVLADALVEVGRAVGSGVEPTVDEVPRGWAEQVA